MTTNFFNSSSCIIRNTFSYIREIFVLHENVFPIIRDDNNIFVIHESVYRVI